MPVQTTAGAAVRGKAPAADVLAARHEVAPEALAAATRALPRDIAAFTSRRAEFALLMATLAVGAADGGVVVGIYAIDGMARIGKTTPGEEYRRSASAKCPMQKGQVRCRLASL